MATTHDKVVKMIIDHDIRMCDLHEKEMLQYFNCLDNRTKLEVSEIVEFIKGYFHDAKKEFAK